MSTIHSHWERYTHSAQFQAGETIFREGDPGDELYIIRSGEVAITKNTPDSEPLILGYRTASELIGEIALISDAPRSASTVATRPTELLAISRDAFWKLLRADEYFRQVVMETLIGHLLTADHSRVSAAMVERELHERFMSLTTEHERMAEVMQLRQETTRFIIHDLRNPLHLAMSALALIDMTAALEPNTDPARFLTMAQGGLTRMISLVDALLDVGRLESGEVQLDLEPTDVAQIVELAVERTQPIAITAHVTLTALPPADALPKIPADPTRLERVLVNLIDNALRFTPTEGAVTVSTWREGDRVKVAVNDTGPGIPADQRERVFDRFVQTETGRKSTGFGLGLAFCRSAILAHKGDIRAEEGENGIGTKMVFSLPIGGTTGS